MAPIVLLLQYSVQIYIGGLFTGTNTQPVPVSANNIIKYNLSSIVNITTPLNNTIQSGNNAYTKLIFSYKGDSVLLDRSPDSWVLLTSSAGIIGQ